MSIKEKVARSWTEWKAGIKEDWNIPDPEVWGYENDDFDPELLQINPNDESITHSAQQARRRAGIKAAKAKREADRREAEKNGIVDTQIAVRVRKPRNLEKEDQSIKENFIVAKENFLNSINATNREYINDTEDKGYIPEYPSIAFFKILEQATKSYFQKNESNKKIVLREFATAGLNAAVTYGDGAEKDVKYFKKYLKKLNRPTRSGKIVEIFRR